MVIAQGDVWWADLPEPSGSVLGYDRPVVVIQSDHLNRTGIGTILSVPLTRTLKWANATGNVLLTARQTGLDNDSVANVSQTTAVPRDQLIEPVGRISAAKLDAIVAGLMLIIAR